MVIISFEKAKTSVFCVNFVFLFSVIPLIMSPYIFQRRRKRRISSPLMMERILYRMPVQDLTLASIVWRNNDPLVACKPAFQPNIVPIGNKDMVILPQQV